QRLVKAGKIKKPKPLPPIKPEDVPYELPQGWEWVRLGDICSYIQRGKGPKYVEVSTHRVISQKCVRWYGLDLEPARYIDPSSLKKYESIRFLRVGDLLWNSTGTGTIGRACLVPQDLEGVEIVADSHVTVVRPIDVCPIFLWRWIQSPTVQNEIEGSASGTTNQIELNTSTVINHLMPLPPLPEQHLIVARIDQLMARCDALEKLRKEREEKRLAVHAAAIKQLLDPTLRDFAPSRESFAFLSKHFGELYTVKENVAELRKAILKLAVMGRLVPQDPNDPPASELLKEIEAEKQRLTSSSSPRRRGSSGVKGLDSRLRGNDSGLQPIKPEEVPYELPQGWEWVRLGDAGAFERGKSKHRPRNDKRLFEHGTYPFVQTGDVSRSKTTENQILTCTSYYNDFGLKQSRLWEKGTLCITIAANIAETGFLGMDACIPDSVVAFLGVDKSLEKLVKVFIDVAKGDLEHFAPSTAQKNINLGIINELLFPLPPLPEQHRIVARIDQLMALCDALDQQIDAATDKQTALLNAVMAEV
ncbi:MAG: restriction endonuclease subunit S, partial [Desulfuromonadales bacterium]|nr:restriction endonuclease subunit S [Desulfuromonadales bacterium]